MSRKLISGAMVLVAALAAGCEPSRPKDEETGTEMITSSGDVKARVPFFAPPPDASYGDASEATDDSPEPTDTATPSATATSTATATATATAPGPAPGMVREKAAVGATGKGQYEPGLVTTPISVYFAAKEKVVYEIQIPQAMKIYKALNQDRPPASHDEFMREIIMKNGIKLPELPAGHKYVYDPLRGELMVELPGGGN